MRGVKGGEPWGKAAYIRCYNTERKIEMERRAGRRGNKQMMMMMMVITIE